MFWNSAGESASSWIHFCLTAWSQPGWFFFASSITSHSSMENRVFAQCPSSPTYAIGPDLGPGDGLAVASQLTRCETVPIRMPRLGTFWFVHGISVVGALSWPPFGRLAARRPTAATVIDAPEGASCSDDAPPTAPPICATGSGSRLFFAPAFLAMKRTGARSSSDVSM